MDRWVTGIAAAVLLAVALVAVRGTVYAQDLTLARSAQLAADAHATDRGVRRAFDDSLGCDITNRGTPVTGNGSDCTFDRSIACTGSSGRFFDQVHDVRDARLGRHAVTDSTASHDYDRCRRPDVTRCGAPGGVACLPRARTQRPHRRTPTAARTTPNAEVPPSWLQQLPAASRSPTSTCRRPVTAAVVLARPRRALRPVVQRHRLTGSVIHVEEARRAGGYAPEPLPIAVRTSARRTPSYHAEQQERARRRRTRSVRCTRTTIRTHLHHHVRDAGQRHDVNCRIDRPLTPRQRMSRQ